MDSWLTVLRPILVSCFGFLALILSCSPLLAQTKELPASLGDGEFWRLITELSESGGVFPNQFMSNEDSAHFVIPALKEKTRLGGVYIGVGSEQNFTYIAAVRPKLAFIVDIRRDNMREHLMYKAIFELSENRADFVSRLFSRRRPAGLDTNSSVKAIFDAYRPVEADPAFYEINLRAVLDRLTKDHGFPLAEADRTAVAQALNAFRTAGPHSLKGFGDTTNPTYADLMAATDLAGRTQSYLESEANFKIVQDLERKNLVVPLTGDFAGDKAIVGIGRYLKEHNTLVDTFYVSNVERYLFDQGDHGKQFYTNAAALPFNTSSTFVRSVTSDISVRLGIPIPDGATKWRSFLYSMDECLKAVAAGRIQGYAQLFQFGKRE